MGRSPLAGWSIGVTADRRADEQAQLLRQAGATVVLAPTLQTRPLGVFGPLQQALEQLLATPPEIVVLTTAIGTRWLFEAAEAIGVADELLATFASAAVLVRGAKACGAATALGLGVAWQAPSATSLELVEHLRRTGVAGRRVAVQLDGRREPALADDLRALAADVVELPIYRWTHPEDGTPARRLVEAAIARRVDVITCTSSPALSNLLDVANEHREALVDAFNNDVAFASIGAVCSREARSAGFEPAIEPRRHRLGALVRAIADHARATERTTTVSVGARQVQLRAASVVIDGDVIELPEREHAVLAALLSKPGAVVSKQRLATEGWRDGADPHAVEAVVSRLRRRVASHLAIDVAARRGYVVTSR